MVVLLTRLPFLEHGFGLDFDAWMLAESARRLIEEGIYIPSRPPGYPLTELALAPLVGLGPLATNGVTALISVLCAVLLFDLLRKAEAPAAFELSVAFSVVPVVWIASVTTIDYLWGLAFSLAGLRSALRDRPDAAGVWIGLATAARAPSILALLPVLCLSKRRAPCLFWSGLIVILIYTPVVLSHGLENLVPQELPRPNALFVARQATVGVLGELGALAFSAALFLTLKRRDAGTPVARAGLLLAAPHILLYLAAPYEAGYLIPALAGIFLWLGSRLPRGGAAALATCLALSSTTGLQRRAPLVRDVDLRAAEMELLEEIVEIVQAERKPTALLCGPLFPKIRYALGGQEQVGRVSLHVAILSETRLRHLLDRGVELRYVPGIETWYTRRTGQSLDLIARPLP